MHPHPVGDVDRLVGVVDPDVHVQAEDDLLARDEPQRLDEFAVARRGGDPLVLQRASGCVPAEPINSPFLSAMSRT